MAQDCRDKSGAAEACRRLELRPEQQVGDLTQLCGTEYQIPGLYGRLSWSVDYGRWLDLLKQVEEIFN